MTSAIEPEITLDNRGGPESNGVVMEENKETDSLRLQKYMADAGLCSRRKAETMIREGHVSVNGTQATIGLSVSVGDKIVVLGRRIAARRPDLIALMMNKPPGVLCTNHDPYHFKTVFTLLPSLYQKHRLFCAGRLDKGSDGLVIITNDGVLAQAITHPSRGIIKRYRVLLNKPLEPRHIEKMLRGVTREGDLLCALKIIPAPNGPDKEKRCEVHLQQGRKREIRRLFEAFGYYVKRLHRFQVGPLVLKKLASGKVRPLKPKELECFLPNQKKAPKTP